MAEFDAILFDFDGVLIDSEPVHCSCWAEVLAPFGVELPWDLYRDRYRGIDDRDMLRHLAAAAEPPLEWQVLWERYPAKVRLFQQKMEQPLFPAGLPELLKRLQAAYKLAVVSSSSRIEIEPPLAVSNLRRHFGALVCGEDVTRIKPAPDPYLLGARLLGAQRPLVVEDSLAGIASGQAAGFEVLPVPSASAMPAVLLQRLSDGSPPGR
jgi:beta-phosphoglucomutase